MAQDAERLPGELSARRENIQPQTGIAQLSLPVESSIPGSLLTAGAEMQNASEYMARARENYTHLEAADAANKLREKLVKLKGDWQQQRLQAATHPDFYQNNVSRADDALAEVMGGVINPLSKDKLKRMAAPILTVNKASLLEHQSTQRRAWADKRYETTREFSMMGLADTWNNFTPGEAQYADRPDSSPFAAQLFTLRAETARYLKDDLGIDVDRLSGQQREDAQKLMSVMMQKDTDKALELRIGAALNNQAWATARGIYAEYGSQMSSESRQRVEHTLNAIGRPQEIAIQASTDGQRYLSPTPQGTMQFAPSRTMAPAAPLTAAERNTTSGLVSLAKGAGFNERDSIIMAAIAMAESNGNPNAHNPNMATGDNSYGLWQINMLGDLGPQRRAAFGLPSNDALFDPSTNAKAAKQVFDKEGFNAWSVYRSGAYRKFLGEAQQVADSGGQSISTMTPAQRRERMAEVMVNAQTRARELYPKSAIDQRHYIEQVHTIVNQAIAANDMANKADVSAIQSAILGIGGNQQPDTNWNSILRRFPNEILRLDPTAVIGLQHLAAQQNNRLNSIHTDLDPIVFREVAQKIERGEITNQSQLMPFMADPVGGKSGLNQEGLNILTARINANDNVLSPFQKEQIAHLTRNAASAMKDEARRNMWHMIPGYTGIEDVAAYQYWHDLETKVRAAIKSGQDTASLLDPKVAMDRGIVMGYLNRQVPGDKRPAAVIAQTLDAAVKANRVLPFPKNETEGLAVVRMYDAMKDGDAMILRMPGSPDRQVVKGISRSQNSDYAQRIWAGSTPAQIVPQTSTPTVGAQPTAGAQADATAIPAEDDVSKRGAAVEPEASAAITGPVTVDQMKIVKGNTVRERAAGQLGRMAERRQQADAAYEGQRENVRQLYTDVYTNAARIIFSELPNVGGKFVGKHLSQHLKTQFELTREGFQAIRESGQVMEYERPILEAVVKDPTLSEEDLRFAKALLKRMDGK